MGSLGVPIAVIGPTASGKSAVGIELAQRLDGEVVNTDSMQLYRGMDIGTAKLTVEERQGIPHHQLDTLEVTQTASVASYQKAAMRDVESILQRGKTPILVGGSMLYVQSLIDDWQFPPTDPQVRARYERRLHQEGLAQLRQELQQLDPKAASVIEENDPRRTVRALEVIELTGKPFTASQPSKNTPPRWGTIIIGLQTTSEWLNPRIDQRTRRMFDEGLREEVIELQQRGLVAQSTAGRAIGYAQVLRHLDGELTLDEAIEKTIVSTRRYVRRQRSWFHRDPRIQWIDAEGDPVSAALDLLP